MHKVCARVKSGLSGSYGVLQDKGFPKTTKLKVLDTWLNRYELNELIEGSNPI
jgi:hypothetical protein